MHDHNFFEIAIVESGHALHLSGEDHTALGPGNVLVVPPGPAHSYTEVKGLKVINIYYLSEWLLDDLNRFWQEPGLMTLFFKAALFPTSRESQIFNFKLDDVTHQCVKHEAAAIADEINLATPSRLLLRSSLMKMLVYLNLLRMN